MAIPRCPPVHALDAEADRLLRIDFPEPRLEDEDFRPVEINPEVVIGPLEVSAHLHAHVVPVSLVLGLKPARRCDFVKHVGESPQCPCTTGQLPRNLPHDHVSCPQKLKKLIYQVYTHGFELVTARLFLEPLGHLMPANA